MKNKYFYIAMCISFINTILSAYMFGPIWFVFWVGVLLILVIAYNFFNLTK